MDSEIESGSDVGYNADECSVIYNDRLANDSSMISRLMIECADFEIEGNDQSTMDSAATALVDHFSATTFWVYTDLYSVYPGLSVPFNYSVTDRLGNLIYDGGRNTTFSLSSGSFSSSLWIDEDGHCALCEEGVWFSDLSIADNLGDIYPLHISLAGNELVLGQNEFTFNVTGCPTGFGVDSVNFTCSICGLDEYNIEDDFVRECLSCDPDDNPGGVCFELFFSENC